MLMLLMLLLLLPLLLLLFLLDFRLSRSLQGREERVIQPVYTPPSRFLPARWLAGGWPEEQ